MSWKCYIKADSSALYLPSFCYSLTPAVEPLAAGELFLDLGQRHPRPLIQAILSACARDIVCLGASQSKFLAKAVCLLPAVSPTAAKRCGVELLFGRALVIPAGKESAAARALPVSLLQSFFQEAVVTRLQALGINTLADVARLPLPVLAERFGAEGYLLHSYSSGSDREQVKPLYPPPELVWQQETSNFAGDSLLPLAAAGGKSLARLLDKEHLGCTEVTLTLTAAAKEYTAARRFSAPKSTAAGLIASFNALLAQALQQTHPHPVEKITLRTGGLLVPSREQLQLFTLAGAAETNKKTQLARVCEHLSLKYRPGAVAFGSQLVPSRREQVLTLWDPLRGGTRGDGIG